MFLLLLLCSYLILCIVRSLRVTVTINKVLSYLISNVKWKLYDNRRQCRPTVYLVTFHKAVSAIKYRLNDFFVSKIIQIEPDLLELFETVTWVWFLNHSVLHGLGTAQRFCYSFFLLFIRHFEPPGNKTPLID